MACSKALLNLLRTTNGTSLASLQIKYWLGAGYDTDFNCK